MKNTELNVFKDVKFESHLETMQVPSFLRLYPKLDYPEINIKENKEFKHKTNNFNIKQIFFGKYVYK